MAIVEHKWRSYSVRADTEILILGTFHPDINTGADFFYGRKRNYLWTLLPGCFNYRDLRGAENLEGKHKFMETHKIGFADIIKSVNVPEDQKANYSDNYIDGRIHDTSEIVILIESLPNLEAVYFTRKTFQGIPTIRGIVLTIQQLCIDAEIRFSLLPTPARFRNDEKQLEWKNLIAQGATPLVI